MPLKYQTEIDKFSFNPGCPEEAYPPEGNLDAFRLSFSPIEHNLNFLPNVVFDRLTNNPFDYENASGEIKCRRCGGSYYLNKDGLRGRWGTLSKRIRQNLGYTHIAQGTLTKEDGIMKTPEESGHFTFYEFDSANLTLKFTILEPL